MRGKRQKSSTFAFKLHWYASERAKVTINDQTCGKLEQKSHWDNIS